MHYLKKSYCFDNLDEENLKLAAFVIFQTSQMAFFEIHQKFKGQFLHEFRVSFKKLLPLSEIDVLKTSIY